LAQDHWQPRLRFAGVAFCFEGKFASDKRAISDQINYATDLFPSMAGPNEPNNETLRVGVPLATPGKLPDPNIKSRETVRIQLPVREPMGKLPPHNPTELAAPAGSIAQDLHPSQFSPPLSTSVTPAPESPESGPKKETLRVPLASEPTASAGPPKNTPPVIPMPHVVPQSSLIAAAPREKSSLLLYWILLGVSALILIIQIWTYLS